MDVASFLLLDLLCLLSLFLVLLTRLVPESSYVIGMVHFIVAIETIIETFDLERSSSTKQYEKIFKIYYLTTITIEVQS